MKCEEGKRKKRYYLEGESEIEIENIINQRYNKSKILSISALDKFKYYTYYNLTLYSKFENSYISSSDSVVLFFIRKPLKCKIKTKGLVLNPDVNNILSSTESFLDYGIGDTVSYFWNCEECKSLLPTSSCTCNIFRHTQENRVRDLEIYKKMMSDMSKYKISLSISVVIGNYTRSCYSIIEILTISQARPGFETAILPSYGGSSISTSEIYFGIYLESALEAPNEMKTVELELIEIASRLNQSIKYSIKDKYFGQIIKSYNNNINITKRFLQENLSGSSVEAVANYTPRIIASSQAIYSNFWNFAR